MNSRFFLIIIILACVVTGAAGQVYLTKTEALELYLGEKHRRSTLFLTDDHVQRIQQKAKAKVESKIVSYYTGNARFAFFESRTIRTMPATFLVVLDSTGVVHAVEMMAFYEPEDYLPPKRWMETFQLKTLESDLWLKRGVHNISGATLSAQAITESIRRILATYDIAIATRRK